MQMEKKKKVGVAIFISDQIDFKTKAIVRDKKGHYKKIKGKRRYKTLVYIYAPNIGAPKYVKQILMDIK